MIFAYVITTSTTFCNEFEFTSHIVLNIPCLTIIMPKMLLSCTKMVNAKKYLFYLIKQLSIDTRITSLTRINDYMFTHTGFQLFLFPTSLVIWKKPSRILCIGLVKGKTILESFIHINRNNKCNLQLVSEIVLYFICIKCLYVTLTYFISIYCYSRINQSRRRAA